MKQVSCATIIVNDANEFLGCVPYGKKDKLDLPKGIQEGTEHILETAIREVLEETGIKISINKLKYIGHFAYLPKKDLEIFIYNYNYNIHKLSCNSTFELYGKQVKEIIGYKSVSLLDYVSIRTLFYKNLSQILIEIFNNKF